MLKGKNTLQWLKTNLFQELNPLLHMYSCGKSSLELREFWIIRNIQERIFRTRPDRPWSPPSLLYNVYRVSFPGVKRPGRGVNHPPPSSAEVKERVELYLYSPSGTSGPGLG